MVFLFSEEGGFRTEEGLLISASGVLSKACFTSKLKENFFFWDSGVLISGIVMGVWELASHAKLERVLSSLPFEFDGSSENSFRLSILGSALTLFRIDEGDRVFE